MNLVEQLRSNCDGRLDAVADLPSALAGWELRELPRGAVLMVKGCEIHVAAPKESRGRWLSRAVIRGALAPILAEYGCAVTSVADDNARGHDFVSRIGFERQENGRYVMKELKYA